MSYHRSTHVAVRYPRVRRSNRFRSWIVPHWYRACFAFGFARFAPRYIYTGFASRAWEARLEAPGAGPQPPCNGGILQTASRDRGGEHTPQGGTARRTVRGAECANARRAPTRRAARRLRPRTNEQAGRGPVTRKPDRKQAPKAGTERLGARPPALRLPGLPCRYATDKLRIEDRGG